MTALITPVGHPTMTCKDISPSISAAFSPNLHRWMKSRGHAHRDGGVAETVYRVLPGSRLVKEFGAGTLFIGCPYDEYEGDSDFSGSLLMVVLCNGSKATRYCHVGAVPSLEVVEGFWDLYLKIGRCAIDPEHKEHFHSSERYSVAGDVRTCLWCGEQQQNIVTERIVLDESWTTTKSRKDAMFIVELETGVWLAPMAGDPGRTLVKGSAQKFETQGAAKSALREARKFRTFKSAKINPV